MSHAATITVERIDAELPQTQCGKCGHDGCRPYAEAIVEGEAVNRCPPGGEATRDRLAAMTGRAALPLIEPAQTPLLAVIREAECIGCTKCIQACPVDAILGAAKQMHTVIESECTGCELCIAPCPVDCIDLVAHPQWAGAETDAESQHYWDWRAANGRRRFEDRQQRLARKAEEKRHKRDRRIAAHQAKQQPPVALDQSTDEPTAPVDTTALKARRATLGARLKRMEKQFIKAEASDRPALAERAATLRQQLETIDGQLAGTPSGDARHRHIAVAAAEQAVRKARQELAHFQRQNDEEGAMQAQHRIREAKALLATASQPAGDASGTPS